MSTDLLTIVYQCSFRFLKVVLLLLSADESFMKSAKSLWSHDFPGPITENFANMILVNCCFFMLVICFLEILLLSTDIILDFTYYFTQNQACGVDGVETDSSYQLKMLTLWIQVLTKQSKWYQDK